MTGVCGWLGADHSGSGGQIIESMLGEITKTSVATNSSNCLGAGCGLGLVTRRSNREVIHYDGYMLVIAGQAYFSDAELSKVAAAEGIGNALLQGYRNAGSDVLKNLHGGFSLVIINETRKELFAAIDRVGGRYPLFYTFDDGQCVFASNCSSIKRHPAVSVSINNQSLFHYLFFYCIPGPETIYKGIQQVPPGGYIHVKDGRLARGRYWQPVYDESDRDSVEALSDKVQQVMQASVARSYDGSKPGCFLSGGTDSSTVAGMLSKISEQQAHTYSIGFDAAGYDEMEYARIAVQAYNTVQHEYYVTPDDVVELIPQVAACYSFPFGNASAIPTYFCAKIAREDGVQCMLAGDGGDELFAGNERYHLQRVLGLYNRIPSGLRAGLIEPFVEHFPWQTLKPFAYLRGYVNHARIPMPRRMMAFNLLEKLGATNVFEPDFLDDVDREGPYEYLQGVYDHAQASSELNRMLAVDFPVTLTFNDLQKVSRMCDLAGVDVEYPILSDEMIDFSLHLPARLKMKGKQLRWFWKYAFRNFLPKAIINKQKHGFGLPFGLWMRENARLKEISYDSLQALKGRQIIRDAFIDDLIVKHRDEHAIYYGVMVWLLMMLELWFQNHVDAQ